jgi:hypothetical protein
LGAELRRRGYPTANVVNWRTPPLFLLVALVEPRMQLGVLALLAFSALILTTLHLTHTDLVWEVLLGVLAEVCVLTVVLTPAARFLPEASCGLVIVISVIATPGRHG